jgi:hypothetical protein
MKKFLWRHIALPVGLLIVSLVLVFSGCTEKNTEGVAIYLTRDDIPPAQMSGVNGIALADPPVISMNEIDSYNAQTGELTLTQSAYDRVCGLEVPVRGKTFVVCVDRKPVYWGAFWTPISSLSFEGITIWKPLSPERPDILTLELGYPSSSFYQGTDPRNDPAITKTLEKAGKLTKGLTLDSIKQLPHSMKGYELYSWQVEGQWHFTLITGTNRNKTTEEITTGENFISQAGWVKIRAEDIETVKVILSKLTEDEEVSWLNGQRSEPFPGEAVNFSFPPAAEVDALKQQAGKYGIKLNVQ